MMIRLFQALAITGMMMIGSSAYAQCGCSGGGIVSGGSYGGGCGGGTNCGRDISQSEAMGLWSGYCNESCYDYSSHRLFGNRGNRGCGGGASFASADCGCDSGCGGGYVDSGAGCGGGCKLRGRLGNGGGLLHGRGGFGGSSCGCDLGCFGYPSGGCGCGGGGGFGSRHGGGLFSHHRNRGCDDGCGGGFLSRLFAHHGNRGGRIGRMGRSNDVFVASANDCGCSGNYFSEAVGYEYGTAGIQSYASGCGSSMMSDPGMNSQPVGAMEGSHIESSPVEDSVTPEVGAIPQK